MSGLPVIIGTEPRNAEAKSVLLNIICLTTGIDDSSDHVTVFVISVLIHHSNDLDYHGEFDRADGDDESTTEVLAFTLCDK